MFGAAVANPDHPLSRAVVGFGAMPRVGRLDMEPAHRTTRFGGPLHTLREMRRVALGPRGEQSLLVRQVTEEVVRELQPKDYLSEILAIRYWVAERCRYANDHLHVEYLRDPQRLCEEILSKGKAVADCDDIATLIATMGMQLGRKAKFVAVGFGAPRDYSHVFAMLQEPKSKTWIVCDPVAGTDEERMLRKVTTHTEVDLDEAA